MASASANPVTTKLFMASRLLAAQETAQARSDVEALWQGAVALTIRAKLSLLAWIAECYQQKNRKPATVDDLIELIGESSPESGELKSFEISPDGWLNQLSLLERAMDSRPEPTERQPAQENLIVAVDTAENPRSPELIKAVMQKMKAYVETLAERHHEY